MLHVSATDEAKRTSTLERYDVNSLQRLRMCDQTTLIELSETLKKIPQLIFKTGMGKVSTATPAHFPTTTPALTTPSTDALVGSGKFDHIFPEDAAQLWDIVERNEEWWSYGDQDGGAGHL